MTKNVPKKKTDEGGDFRVIDETEQLEIKHTPKYKRKENLEDKLIEFINLTDAVPSTVSVGKSEDYVGMQLEAIGEAV